MRIWIEQGRYMRMVNLLNLARASSDYYDSYIGGYLEYPLTHFDTGRPASATYHGDGNIVRRDGRDVLILGDLVYRAQLDEYVIAEKATEESEVRLARNIAGVEAALTYPKPSRRTTAKGPDWLYGYEEALKLRQAAEGARSFPVGTTIEVTKTVKTDFGARIAQRGELGEVRSVQGDTATVYLFDGCLEVQLPLRSLRGSP